MNKLLSLICVAATLLVVVVGKRHHHHHHHLHGHKHHHHSVKHQNSNVHQRSHLRKARIVKDISANEVRFQQVMPSKPAANPELLREKQELQSALKSAAHLYHGAKPDVEAHTAMSVKETSFNFAFVET